jgi:transposase
MERKMERQPGESLKEFIKRWWPSYVHLSSKFNSRKFKKKLWDYKKAARGEFDRLTNSLLKMVGGTIGKKLNGSEKVYIGIGDANFDAGEAQSEFERYFVKKARSLGYIVGSINEYFTSQKCPNCKNFTEYVNGIRVKYCRTCHKYFHRDVMAGQNIAQEMRNEARGMGRLDYLKPDSGGKAETSKVKEPDKKKRKRSARN